METTGHDVAERLVRQFQRMVQRDGGTVTLLGVDGDEIRVGYAPGVDADCDDDACVLPHVELQQLMGEALRRSDASRHVVVELVPPTTTPSNRSSNDTEA